MRKYNFLPPKTSLLSLKKNRILKLFTPFTPLFSLFNHFKEHLSMALSKKTKQHQHTKTHTQKSNKISQHVHSKKKKKATKPPPVIMSLVTTLIYIWFTTQRWLLTQMWILRPKISITVSWVSYNLLCKNQVQKFEIESVKRTKEILNTVLAKAFNAVSGNISFSWNALPISSFNPIFPFFSSILFACCCMKAMGKLTDYSVESYRNNKLSNREIEIKAIFPYRGATTLKKGWQNYCILFNYNKAKTFGYLSDMKWYKSVMRSSTKYLA